MIARPSLEDLKEQADSPFTIIVMAAKRARNLNQGGKDLLDNYKGNKPVTKSLEEIEAGKIHYKKISGDSIK